MKRIALLGCGKLGEIAARGLYEGKVPGCRLVAVLGHGMERARELAGRYDCRACGNLEELLAEKPDYVIEAATGEALRESAVDILAAGSSLICLSIGAFADPEFLRRVEETARAHGSQVFLAPGVIGGFDVASAAALFGGLEATLIKYKYASSSPKCPEGLRELPDHFVGSVREGFALSPRHLNVGISAGLICGDLDRTKMRLETVPDEAYTGCALELEGDFGTARIQLQQGRPGHPVAGPAFAAWSTLAVLKRLTAPITF